VEGRRGLGRLRDLARLGVVEAGAQVATITASAAWQLFAYPQSSMNY